MGAIVIGDLTNLSLSLNEDNLCGVSDVVDSLFSLYIVCYVMKRKRSTKKGKIWFVYS